MTKYGKLPYRGLSICQAILKVRLLACAHGAQQASDPTQVSFDFDSFARDVRPEMCSRDSLEADAAESDGMKHSRFSELIFRRTDFVPCKSALSAAHATLGWRVNGSYSLVLP